LEAVERLRSVADKLLDQWNASGRGRGGRFVFQNNLLAVR